MLSINMRIFKTVLLIAFFDVSVRCLPVADKPTESKIESEIEPEIRSTTEVISVVPQEIDVTTAASSTYSGTTDYYDQRQNGTENYRIHVDGLVFVIAPVEALLLAGAAAGTSEPNISISNQGISPTQSIGELDKPATDSVHNKTGELAISKTIHKPAIRLANFLVPLIRGIRHVQDTSVH